jgi:hypothetical protein
LDAYSQPGGMTDPVRQRGTIAFESVWKDALASTETELRIGTAGMVSRITEELNKRLANTSSVLHRLTSTATSVERGLRRIMLWGFLLLGMITNLLAWSLDLSLLDFGVDLKSSRSEESGPR